MKHNEYEEIMEKVMKLTYGLSIIQLKEQINKVRNKRGAKKGDLRSHEANRQIAEIVIAWLTEHGRFVQAEGEAYWFNNMDYRLYRVSTEAEAWKVFMTTTLGINPADAEYNFVQSQVRYQILDEAEEAEVHVFAHYDDTRKVLYISSFDGKLYRLDGKTVKQKHNGYDEVLFLDHPSYQSYIATPVKEPPMTIDDILNSINFQQGEGATLKPEQQRCVFIVWLLSLPFASLLPTRPIALMVGAKGSGKTSTFRRVLRLLFGPTLDVKIMSKDKEDAFVAATTSHYLTLWDNVDGNIGWLNDHLATASTGGLYTLRRLYTTNEECQYRAKAFVGLTARTPHFKRDDVCDRLLIFRVERLKEFQPESKLLGEIDKNRGYLMGQYLKCLNVIVRHLDQKERSSICGFRLADWGSSGLDIWEALGGEEARTCFEKCLSAMTVEQEQFWLAEDSLFQALVVLIEQGKHVAQNAATGKTVPRTYKAGELFEALNRIADEDNIPWTYQNPLALAKRLGNVREGLGNQLGVNIRIEQGKAGQKVYRFIERRDS